MTRRRSLLLLVLAAVSALTACGEGETSDSTADSTTDETTDVTTAPSSTSTVVVPSAAGPEIAITAQDIFFEPKEITAAAGKLTVRFVNKGKVEHSVLIDGQQGLNLKVQAGEEARGDVTLASGEYVLYCDIAGHREVGMELKLHVT